MYLTLIVLPDGTEIFSGPGAGPKVQSSYIKQMVNDSQELSIGSCCASMFECTLLNPGGELSIAAGDEITVYRVRVDETATDAIIDENGDFHVFANGSELFPVIDAVGDLTWPGIGLKVVDGDLLLSAKAVQRKLVGKYTLEEPVRPTPNKYKITAYDRISWLDKDLTDWLISLDQWPYSVDQMATMVCEACGLELVTESLLNGGYQVQRFAGQGITGRKIMQWIGQISATFCRATPEGCIEFAWYEQNSHILLQADVFSVKLADYQTRPIDRVQIQLTQDDIGVIWPDAVGVTYTITGNYLLTATDPAALETVAGTIYNAIRDITYTPGTITMMHNPDIKAGDIVTIQDRNGKIATIYVMTKTTRGHRDTLECTGSPSRDSSTAVHEESYKALNAKMLEIRRDISGLNVKASEAETRIEENRAYTDERITEVTIAAEGLASTVTSVQESVDGVASQITKMQQSSEEISMRVQSIVDNGVDKVSTEFGLTIDRSAVVIARSGAEVENRLDETGMYVVRSDGTVVMQAAKNGVITQNLNVRGYLDEFGLLRRQAWTDERGRPCVATLWAGG